MNSIDAKETVTKLLNRAIDTLFLFNPKGTALGVILGFVINFIFAIVKPAIANIEKFNTNMINPFSCIILSVFIVNAPYLFIYKRSEFDKEIEQAYAYIRECKKSGLFEKWEIRQMYRNLNEIVLKKIVIPGKEAPRLPDHNAANIDA